jgi:hypothetical protein
MADCGRAAVGLVPMKRTKPHAKKVIAAQIPTDHLYLESRIGPPGLPKKIKLQEIFCLAALP